MIGLRWLRLDKTSLEVLPPEIANLKKLVSVKKNLQYLNVNSDLVHIAKFKKIVFSFL